MDLRELLGRQKARLLFQIAKQEEEGRPDYAGLEASLAKVERDLDALGKLFDPAGNSEG